MISIGSAVVLALFLALVVGTLCHARGLKVGRDTERDARLTATRAIHHSQRQKETTP